MTHRSAHPVQPWDPLDPAGLSAPGPEELRLAPTAGFPADLEDLAVRELQVLHSRLCRQLNHEHLEDSAGPHPETMARYRRIVLALDMRAGVPQLVRPLLR